MVCEQLHSQKKKKKRPLLEKVFCSVRKELILPSIIYKWEFVSPAFVSPCTCLDQLYFQQLQWLRGKRCQHWNSCRVLVVLRLWGLSVLSLLGPHPWENSSHSLYVFYLWMFWDLWKLHRFCSVSSYIWRALPCWRCYRPINDIFKILFLIKESPSVYTISS